MSKNLIDEKTIDTIVENQMLIYNVVKSKLTSKGQLSDLEVAFIYLKVSDRVKEELGALY